jgi:hypothetical protein
MLQWVAVADLVVDETYQRPIRAAGRKNIAAIADGFCWAKFAPILVSPVAGGRYAVIDGQHRAAAAALRGVEALPAMVIIAGAMEQAAAFRAVNGQTTRMSALEVHRAAVASGDPEASELTGVCAAAGVLVAASNKTPATMKPGETLAIGALREGLRRHGRDVCVTQTSNHRPGVLNAVVIQAMFALMADHPQWVAPGARDRLIAAFDHIVILREADKAAVQPRGPGTPLWRVLRDRLAARLEEQLARKPHPQSQEAA